MSPPRTHGYVPPAGGTTRKTERRFRSPASRGRSGRRAPGPESGRSARPTARIGGRRPRVRSRGSTTSRVGVAGTARAPGVGSPIEKDASHHPKRSGLTNSGESGTGSTVLRPLRECRPSCVDSSHTSLRRSQSSQTRLRIGGHPIPPRASRRIPSDRARLANRDVGRLAEYGIPTGPRALPVRTVVCRGSRSSTRAEVPFDTTRKRREDRFTPLRARPRRAPCSARRWPRPRSRRAPRTRRTPTCSGRRGTCPFPETR